MTRQRTWELATNGPDLLAAGIGQKLAQRLDTLFGAFGIELIAVGVSVPDDCWTKEDKDFGATT